jgi:hypothetical protein
LASVFYQSSVVTLFCSQAAELQAALQAQQLQNQLLEQSVQGEILKQQLSSLQQQNAAGTATIPPPKAFGSAGSVADQKKPAPPTMAKSGGRPVVEVASTSKRTFDAKAPTRTAAAVVINGSPSPPLPPPQFDATTSVNGIPPPPPATNGLKGAAANDVPDGGPQSPPPPPQPVARSKSVVRVDAKAGDKNTMRLPPKKIGQIRWPPTSDSAEEVADEAPKPRREIGRIVIEETKEAVRFCINCTVV